MRSRRLVMMPVMLLLSGSLGLGLGSAAAEPRAEGLQPEATRQAAAWTATQPTDVGWSAQRAVAIIPDGRRALVLADDGLRTLDLTRDPAPVTGRNASITGYTMAVRPQGAVGYVGNGSTLYVVNGSGARVRLLRALNGTLPGPARDLTVSANGKWLYVAYGSWTGNYGVRIYSLASPANPRRVAQFRSDPAPTGVAVNHAGTRLAVGHSLVGSVQMVDVKNPRRPRKLGRVIKMPQDNSVSDLVFSKTGAQVYVVGSDLDAVHVVGWNRRAVTRTKSFESVGTAGEGARGIALDRASNRLAVTFGGQRGDVTLVAMSSMNLAVQQSFTGVLYPTAPAISPNGPSRKRIYISTAEWFDEVPAMFLGAVPPA